MKTYRWIWALLVLLLAVLACAGPAPEDTPRLAGTITYEEADPVPSVDAQEMIQTFAWDVLGLQVPDLVAGGKTGEINLPVSTMDGVEVAFDLAGTTTFGLWSRGAASLSYGDSAVSGDLFADMQDGTLGAFAVRVDQAMPAEAATALGIILTTYPGLMGYEFFETPVEEAGFQFTAGKADDIQVQGWGVTLTGTTITAGIKPGLLGGKAVVWVVVASGALATPFEQ